MDIAKWTQYSRFNFRIRQTEPAARRFVRVCTLYTHKLKCYMMSLAFIFCCCPFFCFVWIRFQKSMQIHNILPTQVVYFSSIDKDLMSAAAAVSAATQNNIFNIFVVDALMQNQQSCVVSNGKSQHKNPTSAHQFQLTHQ